MPPTTIGTDEEDPLPRAAISRRVVLAGSTAPLLALAACAATTEGNGSGSPATNQPSGSPAHTAQGPAPSAPSTAPSSTAASPLDAVPSVLRTRGPDITHGPPDRPEVALTFHGQGTMAVTSTVLAACAAANARITVFAVGQWVASDPAQARAVIAAGHELGNHTWSHQQMRQLSAGDAHTEVAKGRAAVAHLGARHTRLFRPSGTQASTATIRQAAAASGYLRCISYGVDPADYTDPGAQLVRRRTRQAVRPGSIVSLHLGHPGTAAALPGILADLATAGLTPVTVSTLLRD